MQSLRGILNFTRTAELGSFAKAGAEMGISAVAVSQNISRLEKALGVRLLARSTRALSLTPEGQAFLEQCKQPLAELDSACQQAASQSQRASGKLRATVISPVATEYLVPLLPQFQQRYPEIELVDQAADGRQLLSLVEQHRPDVVLTDIQMGPMDGFEATRQILKRFCKVALIVTKVKMLLKHRDVHVTLPADRSVPPTPRFRRMRSEGGSSPAKEDLQGCRIWICGT